MRKPSWTIADVEPGDRLRFRTGEYHRTDWEGPQEFEIVVRRTYKSHNFGWVITPMEPLHYEVEEYGERYIFDEDAFYLEDEWIITWMEPRNGEES